MTTPEPLTDEWFESHAYGICETVRAQVERGGCTVGQPVMDALSQIAAAALRWAAKDATKYELSENTTIGGVRERERAERELLIAADRLRAKAAEIEGADE